MLYTVDRAQCFLVQALGPFGVDGSWAAKGAQSLGLV